MKLHVMALGVAGLLLGVAPTPEDVEKELTAMQGAWSVVTVNQDGKPDDSLKDAKVMIERDLFTTQAGDKVLRHGTLKVDPTQHPKAIDLTYGDGPQKGETSLGIYNLHGDSWILAFSVPGKPRPTSFDRRLSTGHRFMVLKKGEAAKSDKAAK